MEIRIRIDLYKLNQALFNKNFCILVFDDVSGFMICCYVLADEA